MTDRQSSRDDQLFVRSIGQLAQLLNRSERAAARTLNCHGLGKKCDDDETGRIVTFYMANARENQVNESVNGNYSILTERLEIKLDVYGEQKKKAFMRRRIRRAQIGLGNIAIGGFAREQDAWSC